MTDDDYAVHDAPQPVPKPVQEYAVPTREEIYKWLAHTPSSRDKALLAILLRIDAGIRENTATKRAVANGRR